MKSYMAFVHLSYLYLSSVLEGVRIEWWYLMVKMVMGDVILARLNSLLFQTWELCFAVKVSEYYVPDCLCEYCVYIVDCLVPNYGIDYRRSVGWKVEGMLQRSSSLSVKIYLFLVVHDICGVIDLESLQRILLMLFDLLMKGIVFVFLVMTRRYPQKLLLGH